MIAYGSYVLRLKSCGPRRKLSSRRRRSRPFWTAGVKTPCRARAKSYPAPSDLYLLVSLRTLPNMSTPRSATSPQAYDNYLKRPQAATIGSGQQIRVSEVVCLQTYEITEVLSKSGGPSTIIPTGSSLGFRNAEDRYLKYALVLRRVVKESLEHVETVLEINSEYINEYLKTCHSDYPGINLSAQPVLIPEPYEILFHHRTAIRNYTSSAAKGLEKQHMEVLVDFISKNLRDVERAYEQNRRGERPKTSFEDLWTIFPPRSVVVTLGDIIECSRVMETAYEVKDNTPTFTIRSWHWDYHDGLFGPSETDLALTSFKGVCDVSSLRMCPLEDAIGDPRTGVKKADIQARGNTWRDIVKSKHLEYHHGTVISSAISSSRLSQRANFWLQAQLGSVHVRQDSWILRTSW